jgi:DNA-binding NtrC family response regulator
VLVIDDEKNIGATLSVCLEQAGCQVTAVRSADDALKARAQQGYDLAFLDLRLGEASGMDLIPKLLADCPNLLIVVMTAYATIDSAVEAIKRGATDYLPKPFDQPSHIAFKSPDFVKYAESFGAKGYRVERAAELLPILEQALADDTVVIIDCPLGLF